jgi:quercetin dioxygenase-like cupin family protein
VADLFRKVPTPQRAAGGVDKCAGPTELELGKETIIVNPTYFVTPELIKEIDIPQRGILSRTLYDDNDVKVVLFGFSAGHELSAHTAPMPAALYFLEGEADLTLGSDTTAVKAGAFAHMPPYLNHAIVAKTPLVMLLIMMKGLKREKDKVSTE